MSDLIACQQDRWAVSVLRVVSALVCGALLSSPVLAQTADLTPYLNTVRTEYGLPAIAAAVTKNGEVIAAAAVGTRILGKDLPVTINDRFHLGSNTKSMTATLAGMMVEEGKLRWNSTLGEVFGDDLKDMSRSLAAVTLEQLLSHTSGIPSDNDDILALYFNVDAFEYNLVSLRHRLLEQWKTKEVMAPAGSPFQYSNLGYVFAGAMIEKVSGVPWEQMMYQRLFVPMDMHTAGLGPQATYGLIDAPVGHKIEADGHVVAMPWGPAADVPQVMAPSGNAHMSILDYAKWAGWNAGQGKHGPALVSPETLRYIQSVKVQTPERKNPLPGTPTSGGYALGWGQVTFAWAGKPLLTHNGSNSMNMAKIVIDTEQNLAIVVTTNFPGAKGDAAAGKVIEHLYTAYNQQQL